MHEPNLEDRLEAMRSEVVALRQRVTQQQAELDTLRGQRTADPPGAGEMAAATPSRRQVLRRLAGGIAAGLALSGAAASGGNVAQAAITDTQIGTLIVPPGKPLPTGTPTTTGGTYSYGLVATDGSAFALSALGASIQSNLEGNFGVIGYASGGSNSGVVGLSSGTNSVGLRGAVSGANSSGLFSEAFGMNSNGVYGFASGVNSNGVYGIASGTGSYAGSFSGNVLVSGILSKGGGSFKIDHPLDPAHQYLSHSFVESPDMKNIYDGLVTLDDRGRASVALPDWFETLNSDFRYCLTALGRPAPNLYISGEVEAGQFAIAGGEAGQRVSWQVTGIRRDAWAEAYRIPVEEAKPDHERGRYLHPELFGQPQEQAIHRAPSPGVAATPS